MLTGIYEYSESFEDDEQEDEPFMSNGYPVKFLTEQDASHYMDVFKGNNWETTYYLDTYDKYN